MKNCAKFKPRSSVFLQSVFDFLEPNSNERECVAAATTARPRSSIQNDQEQCRHCKRMFKKGRCAVHESVCKTVFMGETLGFSWKANSSRSSTRPSTTTASLRRTRKPRSLVGSYLEHNNSLVQCQYCSRRFAPGGADRHIEICRKVENRPKSHVITKS